MIKNALDLRAGAPWQRPADRPFAIVLLFFPEAKQRSLESLGTAL